MLLTIFAICIALEYATIKICEIKKAYREQHKKLQILKDMQEECDNYRKIANQKYGNLHHTNK